MTKKSLNELVQSLEQLDDKDFALNNIIQIIEMSMLKGCRPANGTLKNVFKMSSALASSEVYTRIRDLCRQRGLSGGQVRLWMKQYPLPTAPSDSPTDGKEDSESVPEIGNASGGGANGDESTDGVPGTPSDSPSDDGLGSESVAETEILSDDADRDKETDIK